MKIMDELNTKELVKLILNSRKSLSVETTEIKKLAFIAVSRNDNSLKYGISVKYRNIPESETRSKVFDDLEEIKQICSSNDLIPAIAFVLYDEAEKEAYIYLFTIAQIEALADKDSTKDVIKKVECGIQIKYGINHRTEKSLLDLLNKNIDCTELNTNSIDFTRI